MELFHERSGDSGTVECPNDISNVQVGINGQDIVSIMGTHSGDGRVGTTQYAISIMKGRSDRLDNITLEDFDYVKIVERGLWRGNMRLTVVTLSEVSDQ